MSQIDFLVAAGLISGLLSALAYAPYVFDTLRGSTRPQRASWFIWSVLASISFFAQIAEGAVQSLWFAGVQTGATVLIFLLSLKRGTGGLHSLVDIAILCVAAMGVALWIYTDTPAYALIIAIGVSLLGGTVTITKAYAAPNSETLSTWATCFIASGFAMLAIGSVDWMLLAYPAYLFTLNGAIVLAIFLGRRREAPKVAAVAASA